ncbi:MAG: hypothetical protein ACWGSQ_17020, partial [Longimicrobiales bacterium]
MIEDLEREERPDGGGPGSPHPGERGWSEARNRAVTLVAVAAALFHLSAAGFRPLTALVQRPIHLLLMVFLGLLGVGVVGRRLAGSRSRILVVTDLVLGMAAA